MRVFLIESNLTHTYLFFIFFANSLLYTSNGVYMSKHESNFRYKKN